MEATIKNVRLDGIKVIVWRRTGMSEQASYEVVVHLLPEYIMGIDTVSV